MTGLANSLRSHLASRIRESDTEEPLRELDVEVELSEALLRELYWEQGLTQQEIAVVVGASKGKISMRMSELGMETREDRPPAVWDEFDEDSPLFEYLDWLPPKQREDVRALCLENKRTRDHAEDRGVTVTNIRQNVRAGLERLEEIHEQEQG